MNEGNKFFKRDQMKVFGGQRDDKKQINLDICVEFILLAEKKIASISIIRFLHMTLAYLDCNIDEYIFNIFVHVPLFCNC